MIGPHLGLKTGLIYRPLNNPYISFLLKRRAQAAEADIYEKGREAAIGMISTVRKGGLMMILADQQLREGEDVAFFGHPARTAIAHFKIAAKTGVPIYLARTTRHKGLSYYCGIIPAYPPGPGCRRSRYSGRCPADEYPFLRNGYAPNLNNGYGHIAAGVKICPKNSQQKHKTAS